MEDELLAQLLELKELAESGNESAAHVIAWFDQESDQASVAGTWPDTDDGVRTLWVEATQTARLYWGARLMRWLVNHPGQSPTHFTYSLAINFEDVGA